MERNTIDSMIGTIAGKTNRVIPRNDGDYIGEDGLLYCGNCHTKKQGRYQTARGLIEPRILCQINWSIHDGSK